MKISTNRTQLNFVRKAAAAPQPEGTTLAQDGFVHSKDQDWVDAGKLMKEHGVSPENHGIFQENLATYLAHRSDGVPNQRWQNKIDRELASPYTDDQVFAHLETLEDSLQANLSELPRFPSKVYITGSFAKGRLGANSDLDGFAVLQDGDISAGFDSYEQREKEADAANLFPLSEDSPGYNMGHLMFAGQSVTVSPEQVMTDGFMREAYDKIREARSGDRRETTATYEKITSKLWGEEKTAAEKRKAFESQSFRTRLQNSIMSLGGTLMMTPVIGPIVHFVTDKFARQRHIDFTEIDAADKDWKDAGQLMADRGVPREGHQLLQENLATYLAHRKGGAELPSGRWESKVQRELAKPYSDQEVFNQVDKLQQSLLENLDQMPTYPSKVFITGSFSKGRLGANSDLNGYAVVNKEEFQENFDLFQDRHTAAKSSSANLFPMSEASPSFNKAMMMVEGTSVAVSTEELKKDGYLRQVYREVLDAKPAERQETKPTLDGLTGKMWRSKFERDTLHFKAMRGALGVAGALSSVPLLGPLVEKLAGAAIRQDHKDLSFQ